MPHWGRHNFCRNFCPIVSIHSAVIMNTVRQKMQLARQHVRKPCCRVPSVVCARAINCPRPITPVVYCTGWAFVTGVGEVAEGSRRCETYWVLDLLNPKTLCTASFNIQKFCVLPTVHLCVLRGSQNKERLFLYTALTYRVLKPKQRVFTARYEVGL